MKQYFKITVILFNENMKNVFYVHQSRTIWCQWRLCEEQQEDTPPSQGGIPKPTQYNKTILPFHWYQQRSNGEPGLLPPIGNNEVAYSSPWQSSVKEIQLKRRFNYEPQYNTQISRLILKTHLSYQNPEKQHEWTEAINRC